MEVEVAGTVTRKVVAVEAATLTAILMMTTLMAAAMVVMVAKATAYKERKLISLVFVRGRRWVGSGLTWGLISYFSVTDYEVGEEIVLIVITNSFTFYNSVLLTLPL